MATGRQLSTSFLIEDIARLLPIAFGFGISIMFLIYSIGHLTGGHMNPAVSFMMVLKRQMSWTKMFLYWFAQFLGAMMGASLVWGAVSGTQGVTHALGGTIARPPLALGATTLDPVISPGNGFILEFMGSFIFYFVIAQSALDKRGVAGSKLPAIPIGFSLIVVHLGLIPFTGCGVNPARTFGPSMVDCMAGICSSVVKSSYWIYWVGPFSASLVVAEVTEWMGLDLEENNAQNESELERLPELAKEAESVDTTAMAVPPTDTP